jgi:hypothetical protein
VNAARASSGFPSPGSRLTEAFLLGMAATAYLCFALPLDIYLGNRAEFSTSWSELLGPWLLGGGLAALALALCAAALPARFHGRVMVLTATLLLLSWIQGNLLVWNYGPLDGSLIDWTLGQWRGWLDASLWIGAILAADAWRDRLVRVVPRTAILACLLQAALAALTLAIHPPRPPPPVVTGDALRAMSRFSPERNVLHIIADGFQSDVFADLLAEDGGALRQQLDGFVFFEDHLGAFPYTQMSVPAILGGQVYDNSRARVDFLEAALGRDSILGAAQAAGFDVEIGMPGGGTTEVYRHAQSGRMYLVPSEPTDAAWRSQRQQALLLADLTLFRVAPHFAKAAVYNDQQWLLQTLFGSTAMPGSAFLAHVAFLRDVAANLSDAAPRPSYKLMHLMLSHRPMVMSGDCTYEARVLVPDRANVRNQARCGLRAVLALVSSMRKLGIYDSATIVIGGDHGTYLAPSALAAGSAAARTAYEKGIPPSIIGEARPLLLVKVPNARGPLRISSAPSWIADIPATIADAAGIPGPVAGESALRLDPALPRKRRFMDYGYQRDDWNANYLAPIQEYVVEGRSDDIAAWRQGRLLGAPKAHR